MEFYEYLREKESDLIQVIGLKSFKEEKAYLVHEVEALVKDYIEFKKYHTSNIKSSVWVVCEDDICMEGVYRTRKEAEEKHIEMKEEYPQNSYSFFEVRVLN